MCLISSAKPFFLLKKISWLCCVESRGFVLNLQFTIEINDD